MMFLKDQFLLRKCNVPGNDADLEMKEFKNMIENEHIDETNPV